jgi:hypothetical protein
MTTKDTVRAILESLPDDCSIDITFIYQDSHPAAVKE